MAPTFSPDWHGGTAPALESDTPDHESSLIPCDAWLQLRIALHLSERELQIVQAIFDDQQQDSIAGDLGLSPAIVYRTIQRIYIKLHIGSTAELIVRVMSEYLAFVADQAHPEFYGWSYRSHK